MILQLLCYVTDIRKERRNNSRQSRRVAALLRGRGWESLCNGDKELQYGKMTVLRWTVAMAAKM